MKRFNMDLENKSYSLVSGLELKENANGDKIITGYASTYGNLDNVGDVVAKGAFDDFISSYDEGKKIPILWQHSMSDPIGEWTSFVSDDKGLLATGILYKELSKAQEAAVLFNRGAVTDLSIGYYVKESSYTDDGNRVLEEIELVETSLVTNPANPQANILSVKAEDGTINPRALEKHLRDVGFSQTQSKNIVHKAMAETQRDVVEDEPTHSQDDLQGLLKLIKGKHDE